MGFFLKDKGPFPFLNVRNWGHSHLTPPPPLMTPLVTLNKYSVIISFNLDE